MLLTFTQNAKSVASAFKVIAALADDVTLHFGTANDGCCLWLEAISLDSSTYLQLWLHRDDAHAIQEALAAPVAHRVSCKKMSFALRELTTLSDVLQMQVDARGVVVTVKTKKSESTLDVMSPIQEVAEELLQAPADGDCTLVPFDVKALAASDLQAGLPGWPEAKMNKASVSCVIKPTLFKTGVLLIPRDRSGPAIFSFPVLRSDGLSRFRAHVCQLHALPAC